VSDRIREGLDRIRDWTYEHYHYAYVMGTGWICQDVFGPSHKAIFCSWMTCLAAGVVLEPCVNPYRQVYGKSQWRLSPDYPEVALTFDDGPGEDTAELLDLLAAEKVSANFFCVGQQMEKYPDLVRRIVDEGHLIGNHTYSHPNLMLCGPQRTRQELQRVQELFLELTGQVPDCWRAPFGFRAPWTQRVADQLKLRSILWSINPRDFQNPGSQVLVDRVNQQVEQGVIVLLHDGFSGRGQTLAATRQLIPLLRERHYQFVRLDQAHA